MSPGTTEVSGTIAALAAGDASWAMEVTGCASVEIHGALASKPANESATVFFARSRSDTAISRATARYESPCLGPDRSTASKGIRHRIEQRPWVASRKHIMRIGRDAVDHARFRSCLLYTSPSPRDGLLSRMPSSA